MSQNEVFFLDHPGGKKTSHVETYQFGITRYIPILFMKLNSSGLFGLIFPFDYISRSHPPRIMRSNLFTDLPYPLYIGHPSDSEVVCSADLRFGSRPKSV